MTPRDLLNFARVYAPDTALWALFALLFVAALVLVTPTS